MMLFSLCYAFIAVIEKNSQQKAYSANKFLFQQLEYPIWCHLDKTDAAWVAHLVEDIRDWFRVGFYFIDTVQLIFRNFYW